MSLFAKNEYKKPAIIIIASMIISILCVLAYFEWNLYGFSDGVAPINRDITLSNVSNPRARAIMSAVFDSDKTTVREMLRNDRTLAFAEDGNPTSEFHIGLLEVAIFRENKSMVNLLLDEGVSPNFPAQFAPIGLALAANDPWYANRLFDAGADPDPVSEETSFHLADAARNGDLRAMSLLLQHGAKLTAGNSYGGSALLIAANSQEFRAAEYLYDHGSEIWAVNPRSGIALGTVCSVDPGIRPFRRHKNLVEAILASTFNTDVREEIAARSRLRGKLLARGYPCPTPTRGSMAREVLAGRWPPSGARQLGAPAPSAALSAEMSTFWNADGSWKRSEEEAGPRLGSQGAH